MKIFVPKFRTHLGEPYHLEPGDKVLYREHVGWVVRSNGFSVGWRDSEGVNRDAWQAESPDGPKAIAEAVAQKYGLHIGRSHTDEHGMWWVLKQD